MNKNYRFKWDDKNCILNCFSKSLSELDANNLTNEAIAIMEEKNIDKIDWIVDLSEAKKTPSSKGRKYLIKLIKYPKMGRVAFVSPNTANRIAVKFIFGAVNKKIKVKTFREYNSAMNWLTNKDD